ncbi:MAG: hypothetical protein WA268_25640 [Xanthobacteraceae bacterium]
MKSPAPGTFDVSPLQTIDFLAIAQVRFIAIQVSDDTSLATRHSGKRHEFGDGENVAFMVDREK